MKSLGQQIVAEFYECDSIVLNDPRKIEEIMCEAALAAGATIVSKVFHTFSPHGVSGAVIIAESHLAIHTWPEYGYAAVDLFTCGSTVLPEPAYRYLKKGLCSRRSSTMEMKRGQLEVVGDLIHKPTKLKKAV
jgi:S-adenosylmethionine decarboxylase proenzyme